jgi:hypothetical protein
MLCWEFLVRSVVEIQFWLKRHEDILQLAVPRGTLLELKTKAADKQSQRKLNRVFYVTAFFSENICHQRDNCKKCGKAWEVEETVVDRNIMRYT